MQSFIFDRSWSRCLLLGVILNTAVSAFPKSATLTGTAVMILNAASQCLADPDGNVGQRFESALTPDSRELQSAD